MNASTGVKVWSYATGDQVESSPAIAGGRVYIGSYDGKVYCLPMTFVIPSAPDSFQDIITYSLIFILVGAIILISIAAIIINKNKNAGRRELTLKVDRSIYQPVKSSFPSSQQEKNDFIGKSQLRRFQEHPPVIKGETIKPLTREVVPAKRPKPVPASVVPARPSPTIAQQQFCAYCGKSFPRNPIIKYCPYCGKQI